MIDEFVLLLYIYYCVFRVLTLLMMFSRFNCLNFTECVGKQQQERNLPFTPCIGTCCGGAGSAWVWRYGFKAPLLRSRAYMVVGVGMTQSGYTYSGQCKCMVGCYFL
jgi:hypothetical protein